MPSSSPRCIPHFVWVQRLLALCLISFPGYSSAGIAEFNAAAQAGDYVAAARETASAWESYDKSRDSAVTIAREFAFVNYLAGDFEAAAGFIAHLVDDGALTARDDQPLTSRVLAALAQWRVDASEDNRRSLLQRLQERAADPSVDNITLLAAEELYNDDWMQGRTSEVAASASQAIEFFDRTDGLFLVHKRRAQLIANAADFITSRSDSSYVRFGEVHNAIVADVDSEIDESQRQALIPLKWIAQAWAFAAASYFNSLDARAGTEDDYEGPNPVIESSKFGHFYENANVGSDLPLCDFQLEGRVNYPSSAVWRGLVGAVIFKMDVDERGRGSNVSILASVPAGNFGDSVLKAESRFRITALKGEDTDACQLQRKDQVAIVRFAIR